MITQQEIFKKYPEMFKLKDKSIQESCMAWGLEVPREWLPIIDELCQCLHGGWIFDAVDKPQVVADQVKSKFGQLRFYYHLEFKDDMDMDVVAKYRAQYDGMICYAEMRIRKLKSRDQVLKEYMEKVSEIFDDEMNEFKTSMEPDEIIPIICDILEK